MTSPGKHPLAGFRALAFDFDGTLVDTLSLHYEAYRLTFSRIGLDLSEDDFYPNLGGKAAEAIPLFLRGRACAMTIEQIHHQKKAEVARLFEHAPLKLFPAARLLGMFAGVLPIALVSSGSRAGIEQLLERLGWSGGFDVIVTGEAGSRRRGHGRL
jgi:beta-phosphoglucomutase-like phosphatase (HAD superfamily)